MAHKFFINEENLGDIAEKWQAEVMVEKLQELGWDVEYGDSIGNKASDNAEVLFDRAFIAVLETPKRWMEVQPKLDKDVFGPEVLDEDDA